MAFNNLRRTHHLLSQQFGIDLRRMWRMPRGALRYLRDLRRFRSSGNSLALRLHPCLHDWWEQAGAVDNEYFWQDLFVARMVYAAAPQHHVDVGSRLDGFVAHVASFRQIEVFDVRPLKSSISGITFRQADMMKAEQVPLEHADSASCLHAIEHFGLGRYGDPIEADGVALGMKSLARLLKPGGVLYLSCPLGPDEVSFNAHRSLSPETLIDIAAKEGLETTRAWLFDSATKVFDSLPLPRITGSPIKYSRFTLALYLMRKPSAQDEQP